MLGRFLADKAAADGVLEGIITDPATVGQRLLVTTPKGWRPAT